MEATRYDNSGTRAVFASMASLYTGFMAAYRADGSPSLFYSVNDEDSHLGKLLLGVFFAGGGAALSRAMKQPGEESIEIGTTPMETARAAKRLRRFVVGEQRPPRLHLSLVGGRVFTRTYDDAKAMYREAGVNLDCWSEFNDREYGQREDASRFNMLRRFDIAYSVRPQLDLGLSLVNSGEPILRGCAQEGWAVAQTQKATAYLLTARVYSGTRGRTVGYFAGGGVGIMSMHFKFRSEKYQYPDPGVIEVSSEVKETGPAGCLFAGLEVPLDPNRSLAFGLDYVLARSYDIEGNAEAGISDQKVRFGNLSITVALGVHF